MIYLDTETCGLHGLPVILQYAEDDGPVQIWEFWRNPICESLEVIEKLAASSICGFNLAFDWFHLCKMYTTMIQFNNGQAFPEDYINEFAVAEEQARFLDICLKPQAALDIMLLARKTEFQSLMARDDIKIRRIPTALAWKLADELERRVRFDDIYFARQKDKFAPRWKVYDIRDEEGNVNPNFKDIKLKFKASGGLKNLYRHVFRAKETGEEILDYREIEVAKYLYPVELGYAPFALAVGKPGDWNHAWPSVIQEHIAHWGFNEKARKYAANDVLYTRALHHHLGNVSAGDDDSELACAVAAMRWKGFAIDANRMKELKTQATTRIHNTPTAPKVVKRYVTEHMDEIEKISIRGSTKRVVLEEISKWTKDDGSSHPSAVRAQEVLDARQAIKEIENYDKLLKAGRFHASFVIIGTLSSRMSGADKFNPQGVKHTSNVRESFPLADGSLVLCGGDFKSFEVSLAAAVFKDPALDMALKSGKKIHAMFAVELFPGETYESILKSEGTSNDMYDKGKKGVFLVFYGGNANTFKTKLGIAIEIGERAYQNLCRKFPKIGEAGRIVEEDFGALRQPNGIGTKIEWHEPKDFVESFLGFKRYFTLENRVMRTLFEMAQNLPQNWRDIKIKVVRRERVQTAAGAVSSALYGAAFGIQSGNIRAAKNHKIQSPGAQITKRTQRALWQLQPAGVSPWKIMMLNVHDELMCPMIPTLIDKAEEVVKSTVASFTDRVPLLAIDWFKGIPNWGKKKG